MTPETIQSQENKFKVGQQIRMPLLEGLDEMEPWIISKIDGDEVTLMSTLMQGADRQKSAPMGQTGFGTTKTTTLPEIEKYN